MPLLGQLQAEIQFAGYEFWAGGDKVLGRLPPEQTAVVVCPYGDHARHGKGPLRTELDEVSVLLRLSSILRTVEGLLELIAYDFDSWVGMYRVFEYVQANVIGFRDKQWASTDELRRFKQTANSFPHLGKLARHGDGKAPTPKSPMNKAEALSLVQKLCRHAIMEWRDENNAKKDKAGPTDAA